MRQLAILFLSMILSLSSCSDGEDGTDGVNGRDGFDGINGTDGKDGTNGQDGANVVGYDELAKYGHVSLQLEGIRADGVPFQDSTIFKFLSVDPSLWPSFNQLFPPVNNVHTIHIVRRLSAPEDVYQGTGIGIFLKIANLGQESQKVTYIGYGLHQYVVIGDDAKYFVLSHTYENFYLPSMEIKDFMLDETKNNHLTFTYKFTIPADLNETGHELHISGDADVFLSDPKP
ncbi:hypothetical protein [Flagellimonas baculiformis]|uniref:hypothetical protein n=1 Tax=Flagellimonas baculiformis TaxID=3067310 RepID=UPI00296F7062|nr:hypothetical protein [Muricauda sp. D6]